MSTRALVDVFLRKAQWAVDDNEFDTPQAFLRALMEQQYPAVIKGRQIQAVSGNGRSTTFQLPMDMTPREIVETAELAYQMLDNDGKGSMTYGDFSCLQR